MRPSAIRRLPAAIRTAALASVIAIALGACSGQASTAPTATPESSPTSSPTAAPGELALERVPDTTACDAIGVDYRSVTFHIDPTADPQIWAVADTGTSLRVRWDSTFAAADATVVDDSGAVVLEDGATLAIPDGSWPDLDGHMVCPGPNSLTILDEAPAS
jgi:hypothetical protein